MGTNFFHLPLSFDSSLLANYLSSNESNEYSDMEYPLYYLVPYEVFLYQKLQSTFYRHF